MLALLYPNLTPHRLPNYFSYASLAYSSRHRVHLYLPCERLTGEVAESFTNAAMAWGTETEPMARAHYEMVNSVLVDQVGFIAHPDIEMAGASPDGIVGNGIIEIKCPNVSHYKPAFQASLIRS